MTRYAIALSNTIPVIEFAAHNMYFIEDISASPRSALIVPLLIDRVY